ncbi:MAG: MBL fold metallo-hydrolase [Eubacteriales bacterium]|nr:MBL fold metallo-hydrolase [Eubacteriales bacterium]
MRYKITKLVLGACITNVYIVSNLVNDAVLIDPADEADKIIDAIEEQNLNLKYIFITHGHTDHILALKEVKEHFNVPVVISKIDAYRLEDEELINERPYVTIPYKAVKPDILISHGDVINLGDLSFLFYGMPGHTDGSMAIVMDDVIFSGDTLLFEKHGKTTLPGGNEELLVESINKMMKDFTGDYKVLTGHREETTLEHERMYNPYVRKG